MRQTGGMHAGLLGYDLAAAFERLPHLDPRWPMLAMARYPAWAEFDRAGGLCRVRGDSDAGVRELADLLSQQAEAPGAPSGHARLVPRWSRERYLEAARRARDYVHAGEVFQVNLSQGFDIELAEGDAPWPVFARLCADSPAPHAAFLRLDADHVVMTNSPERFLDVRDGHVEARPIKGTRRRAAEPEADAALAAELSASAKDRAENLMIVDLMRNDLSRVCRAGSVNVPRLCELETYANVHHLVSVVEGELDTGRDVFDLLACVAHDNTGTKLRVDKGRTVQDHRHLWWQQGTYCGDHKPHNPMDG